MSKKIVLYAVLAIVAVLLLIQLVPYGRDHSNPPVVQEPVWDSPQTEALVRSACYDCHSNEVVWPFYSNIAPFSWLVQHDVDEGRSRLNFSEWNRRQEIREITEIVQEGDASAPIQAPAQRRPIERLRAGNACSGTPGNLRSIAGQYSTLKLGEPDKIC